MRKEKAKPLLPKHMDQWTREILEQYFSVNGRDLTAELYFDTFSELVDQTVGDNRVEKLNGILFEKLEELFDLIPRKYHIHVNIRIRDYGDYTPEEAERIIRRNLILKIYGLGLESRRKHIMGLSLLAAGAAMLIASYFLSDLNWPQLIFDVINISGTLFVWEAADITLIERGESAKHIKQYLRKFREFRMMTVDEAT